MNFGLIRGSLRLLVQNKLIDKSHWDYPGFVFDFPLARIGVIPAPDFAQGGEVALRNPWARESNPTVEPQNP
jgi:hypothetical protein